MNSILETILETGKVLDAEGKPQRLHSHTSREQCHFLRSLVDEIDARVCLEIGLAYGVSALAVCEKIFSKGESVFFSIDPQQSWWGDIGLLNLEKAGFNSILRFFREHSHDVLPRLKSEGVQLDFTYVDTTKLFDVVMVDVYYATMMTRIGGLIVLDDCSYPALNTLARYLANLPQLSIFATYQNQQTTLRRRAAEAIVRVMPFRDRVFSERLLVSDQSLGVNANCVAFQVVDSDIRNWDWWKPF